MENVIEIVYNLQELLKELNYLSSKYKLSTWTQDLLRTGYLSPKDPWNKYKNNKWVIISQNNIIRAIPYDAYIKYYKENK